MEIEELSDKLRCRTILLTGASGFIGNNLVSKIVANENEFFRLILLCRSKDSLPKYLSENESVVVFEHDLLKPLGDDFDFKVDVIVHLAAKVDFFEKGNIDVNNSLQLKHLLDYATKLNTPPRFVFASTWGAVDRRPWDSLKNHLKFDSAAYPRSKYGLGKFRDELTISESTLPEILILRLPWIVGSGMRRHHVRQLIGLSVKNSIVSRVNWPGSVGVISNNALANQIIKLLQANHTERGFVNLREITTKISIGTIFKAGLVFCRAHSYQIAIPSVFLKALFKFRGFLPFQLRCLLFDVLLCENSGSELKTQVMEDFEDIVRDVNLSKQTPTKDLFLTGCSYGLGWELAKVGYLLGFNVYGVDRALPKDTRYFKNFIQADLAKVSELNRIASIWESLSTGIQKVLVNNAGVCYRDGDLSKMTSAEKVEAQIQLNLQTPMQLFYCLEEKLPLSGVINISSSSSLIHLSDFSIYGATKSALAYWSQSVEDSNVKFLTVIPSGMNTSLYTSTNLKGHTRGLLNPKYVALKILNQPLSRNGVLTIGSRAKVMLAMSKIMPTRVNYWIFRQLVKKLK